MLKLLLLTATLSVGLATAVHAQTSNMPTTPPAAPMAVIATTPTTTAAAPGTIKGSTLINMNVKNDADETIGDINDVLVAPDGRVGHIIVSVGGFLGVGTRLVAIAWNEVKVDMDNDVALVNVSKQQLLAAPEFKDRRTRP